MIPANQLLADGKLRQLGVLLLLSVIIAGCFSNRGFVELNSEQFFKESPQIVTQDGRYFLRFRYGEGKTYHFLMNTDSKIKEGYVQFSIPATTSTGNPAGRLQYEEILNLKKIELIKAGKVFWNYKNQLTPLPVENITDADYERYFNPRLAHR